MFQVLFLAATAMFLACSGGRPEGKTAAIVEGWGRLEDPDGDCTVSVKGGRVTMVVPGGERDLRPGKANAPRILQDIDGNFSVQVKVSGSVKPEIGVFRAGTLLIWQDAQNFVRLDSACAAGGDSSFEFSCHLQVFKDGKAMVSEVRPLKDGPTHLRLERRGSKLVVSFSQKGVEEWGAFEQHKVDLPRKLKVGVAALNLTRSPFTLVLEDLIVGRDLADARRFLFGRGWPEWWREGGRDVLEQ